MRPNTLRILLVLYIGVIYSTLYVMRGIEQSLVGFLGRADYKIFINLLLLVSGFVLLYFAWRQGMKNFAHALIPIMIITYLSWDMHIPAEKIHFIEYGFLGILVFKALPERTLLYVIAGFVFTTLTGFVDEVIQYFLPNRVFDWRDVWINAISGALGLWAGKALYPSA